MTVSFFLYLCEKNRPKIFLESDVLLIQCYILPVKTLFSKERLFSNSQYTVKQKKDLMILILLHKLPYVFPSCVGLDRGGDSYTSES